MTQNTKTPPELLTGRLFRIVAAGYGFISIGPRKPNYYIHISEVDPEHWVVNQRFQFSPGPPKKPGAQPTAINPIPID